MTETEYSLRYWIVTCLGCGDPVPLFAEPQEADEASVAARRERERPYFRAWCTSCGREYPYLSAAMISRDEPPLDKQHRPIEFTRIRQRVQVRRAGA